MTGTKTDSHREPAGPAGEGSPGSESATLPAANPTPDAPPPAGTRAPIGREQPGRYRLLRELARGGQGVVHVAWDAHLGREVAFKQLLSQRPGVGSEDSLTPGEARFVREARITAQLDHPGIETVQEVGRRAEGSLYVTQKLVRGKTLAETLAGCKSLKDRMALLQPFLGICQAVAFAHGRGVIHRDLKPGNVLLGDLGEAVVLDWGLGRTSDEAASRAADTPPVDSMLETDAGRTRDGALIGTPAYMSPEQAIGATAEVDARSDVWSLGVMLYEILTGQRPFDGKSTSEVLRAVATAPLRPVRELCPSAPEDLAAVAERALTRDPARRYPSAKELVTELAAWLSGGRVVAHDYSAAELLRRFASRYRWQLVSSALLLAPLLWLLGGAIVRAHRTAVVAARWAVADARLRAHDQRMDEESRLEELLRLEGEREGLLTDVEFSAALARETGSRAPPQGELERKVHALLRCLDADTPVLPPSLLKSLEEELAAWPLEPAVLAGWRRRQELWPQVAEAFARRGLAPEMADIAFVESQFNPAARTSIGSAGLWLFMPDAARRAGLRVDDQVDERLDVERSTQAAAKTLAELLAKFGGNSPLFALVSYNIGDSGLMKSLVRVATEPGGWRRGRTDPWRLYRLRYLTAQVRDYLTDFLAVGIAAQDPARYGLE